MRSSSRATTVAGLLGHITFPAMVAFFAVVSFAPAVAHAQADDDVWTPDTGVDDGDVWTADEGDDDSWKDESQGDADFFEETDKEKASSESDLGIEQFYGKHYITLEYRDTTVLDDPRDVDNELHIGPPPVNLTYFAYGFALDRINYFKIETEYQEYAPSIDPESEDAPTDGAWTLLSWDQLLMSGSRLYLDLGTSWTADSSGGFNTSGEYGWSWGSNLDLAAGLKYKMSSTGGPGWRFSGKATAFLTPTTSAEYKGWYAVESTGYKGSRNQVRVAQHLGHRTGLNFMARSNVTSSDDFPDKRSRIFGLEVRHRLSKVATQFRLGYRWYADNASVDHTAPEADNTEAEGVSLGFSQPFYRGSVALYYRHFTTSASVDADSWWVLLDLTF